MIFHFLDGRSVTFTGPHIEYFHRNGDCTQTYIRTHSGWAFWVKESPKEIKEILKQSWNVTPKLKLHLPDDQEIIFPENRIEWFHRHDDCKSTVIQTFSGNDFLVKETPEEIQNALNNPQTT